MTELLDRPFTCPECNRKVRQLYSLTRRNPTTGRWENVKACLACLGPADDDPGVIGSQFRGRAIQR